MKRLLVVAVSVAVMMGAGASSAFAGEETGKGKPTAAPENANSICAFSGREDDPRSPKRTQTPAEVWLSPEELTPDLPGDFPDGFVVNPPPGTPGHECNGNTNGLKK
jgi:hypothetical protein